MSKPKNVLIVGVGGQGTLVASRVLAGVAQARGHQVKVSEIHGMSQRGGSVVTQVRFGPEVYSPVIPPGGADCILALEKLEGLRWLPYLAPGGKVVLSDQEIYPLPVLIGQALYPSDAGERLCQKAPGSLLVPGRRLAEGAGSVKAVNTVLLGVLARLWGEGPEDWLAALAGVLPARLLEVNRRAFEAGYNWAGANLE